MNVSDIHFHIYVALRRLPIIIVCTLMAAVAGIVIAFNLPPVYRATAKVLLESPRIPAELARTTVSGTAIDQIQVIEQEIKTRDHLLALDRRFHLRPATEDAQSDGDLIDDLRGRIQFERLPFGDGNMGESVALFAISFDSNDRALSTEVSNYLVSYVMSKNAESRAGRAGETMLFFKKEVSRLGGELSVLETQISDFKTNRMQSLPESLEFRRTQQLDLQERLANLDREEAALRGRRLTLMRLREIGAGSIETGLATPEQKALEDLNRALSLQLSQYSEGSPKVVALRSQIAELKARTDRQHEDGDKDADKPSIEPGFAEIDDRLEFIAQERATANSRLAELTAAIEATPETERRLSALERSHDNKLTQYNAAVAKLAEASTAERIEAASKGGRFALVEPAVLPKHGIGPKRRLVVLGVTALGGATGLALVVLLELMNGALRRPSDVAKVLETQPLVTIPYFDLAGDHKPGRLSRLWLPAGATAIMLIALLVPWPANRSPATDTQDSEAMLRCDGPGQETCDRSWR